MVSIITLTCNHLEDATRPYIESLFEHTAPDAFELIVVDNGSTDGTVEYLRGLSSERGNVRVRFNDMNVGYPQGNNEGLRMISDRCDIIGLFNNDILFTPDWLPAMRGALDGDPRIGLASPRINKNDRVNSENYLRLYRGILARHKEPFTWNITPYFCCVMMRRVAFETIGFLDEGFSPAFFEDDDYSFRSLYAGYRNGYVNTAFVLHNHCTTSGHLPERRALIQRNRERFYDKHYLGMLFYEQQLDRRRPLRRLRRIVGSIFGASGR